MKEVKLTLSSKINLAKHLSFTYFRFFKKECLLQETLNHSGTINIQIKIKNKHNTLNIQMYLKKKHLTK